MSAATSRRRRQEERLAHAAAHGFSTEECEHCAGNGMDGPDPCATCDGAGRRRTDGEGPAATDEALEALESLMRRRVY